LRTARLWAEKPSLNFQGKSLPPHWSRIVNKPDSSLPFENDGHGLIALFLYKLWQRLPERDAWLHAHWVDVKAAGDWIPWQFDHPQVSGTVDEVLYTTGESAAGKGYSVYADYVCMDALQALAQMANSIGETQSGELWRDRAEKMRKAIPARYFTTDPKYGQVWTLDFAGWPNKSTVLGPPIFPADYQGFAPEDDNPKWRARNEATYQRLIDSYRPFGFYGQAMGYGQGFVTQSALLLDRMHDATQVLDWTAKQIYDPRFGRSSCRRAYRLIQPANFGIGPAIWVTAYRRHRSSRSFALYLEWMTPNRIALGFSRECPTAGARWQWRNIRCWSNARGN
jgi:hypothetical protein